MDSPRLLICCTLLLVLCCFGLMLFTGDAHAQNADKSLAAKDGMELGTKEFDQDKLPGKLEMGLAVGSFFVMIAVVKWL
jgi:hypothetical protein